MAYNPTHYPDYPDIKVVKSGKSSLFCNYVFKAIPLAFDESLSYYECLCGLLAYLRDTIIPTVNNNADAVLELQNLYDELHDYVEHYFDNLDVQEEINNKLDEMYEDGLLEQIIEQYINSSCLWCFDTVADMKSAQNLISGSYARTLGYYAINDGGSAMYRITDTASEDEYQEELGDNLYATLVNINNTINTKQFGTVGDGVTDDSENLQKAFNYAKNKKIIIKNGTYLVSTVLSVPSCEIDGDDSLFIVSDFDREHFIRNEHFSITATGSSITDTIVMYNMSFRLTKITTLNRATILGMANLRNSSFRNLKFYCDAVTRFCPFDFYTNNRFIDIDNIYCVMTNGAQLQRTALGIREFTPYNYNNDYVFSSNFHVSNFTCYKDGKDEILWIDSWKGKLENVIIENSYFADTDTVGNNLLWVGVNGDGSSINNVQIINCTFYKENLANRIATIGKSEGERTNSTANNILIDNCNFIMNGNQHTSSQVIGLGKYLIDSGCIISNCLFNMLDDNSERVHGLIESDTLGVPIISRNNRFKNFTCSYALNKLLLSDGDIFDGSATSYTRDVQTIKNCIINNSTGNIVDLSHNTITEFKVLNNSLKCTTLFNSSNNDVNTKFFIENNDIQNENYIFSLWNNNSENYPVAYMTNNNIKTKQISGSNQLLLYLANLTVNGLFYGEIPSRQQDRSVMAVGTAFISSTPTKTIVRKVTDGVNTSDWEEL